MAAKDDLAKAQAALDDGVQSYSFEGKTYSLTKLKNDLIPALKKRAEAEAKEAETTAAEEAKKAAGRSVSEAQKSVDAAQKKFDGAVKRFITKGTISEAEVNRLRLELQQKQEILARLSGRPTVAPTTVTQPGKPTDGDFIPPVPMGVVPSVSKTGATGATGGTVTTTEKPTGQKPTAPDYQPGWEDAVRREYSKYAWMLDDLDRTKYKDVFDLLAEAVNPQTKITDPAVFQTRFEGTSWYQELATQQTGRKVRAAVGALSFNPANYAKLLNSAMRFGWEGDNLKAEAYKEAFRKNDDGTFANPNAVGEARKSNDYLAIKTIGNAYLSPMSDDRIVETLTGKTTRDDLLRIYREKAKISNPHLAQAIDAGVTLEDIAYDYRKMAADVLGVPLAGIPLSEDFLGSALKGSDPAKPRLLTTNEWKAQLKSNPDFGYQFTANARKEVNDIVSSLEKAFGFVR